MKGKRDAAQLVELEKFQNRGGGVVTIHWAIGVTGEPLQFAKRVGLAYPAAKYRHGVVDLKLVTDHPITRGFPATLRFTDESYWPFIGDTARVRLLGTSDEKAGAGDALLPIPIFWTHEPAGGGRAFVCIFGHYTWTFDGSAVPAAAAPRHGVGGARTGDTVRRARDGRHQVQRTVRRLPGQGIS